MERSYFRMVSLSSLYGNPKTDIKAGNRSFKNNLELASRFIPYYNANKSASTVVSERERGVALFNAIKKRITSKMLDDYNKAISAGTASVKFS